MAIPPPFLRFVRALYRCLRTQLYFDGEIVGSVSIASRVKQGCPLSGTLFALGHDPRSRRYVSTITSSSSHIFAFAGDIALVLQTIRRQLPAPFALFTSRATPSGVTLRASKWDMVAFRPGLLPDRSVR